MHRRIDPEQARLGMYVHAFGGSWLDHPFWKRRFVLTSERDVERVRLSDIPYLVIDDALGIGPDAPQIVVQTKLSSAKSADRRRASTETDRRKAEQRRSDHVEAKLLAKRSAKVMRSVLEDARMGRAVRLSTVTPVVADITKGMARMPRTMLAVIRLRKKDEYTYFHSVAVCTLMVNLARHMDKTEAEVRDYGLAGLLHDVGKMTIPEPILNKSGRLTDEEYAIVRDHPEHGYRLLLETSGISDMALDVCRHHHEKIDGSGYPFGHSGEDISVPARLGAICDVYDALTSERAYKEAWTPARALAEMQGWTGHFDEELLFTFMQSIGIFPPGMLVELRSNRVGIVLDNQRRNSRPRVLAFYTTRDRAFIDPEVVVTGDTLSTDNIVARARPAEWGLSGIDLSSEDAVRKAVRDGMCRNAQI